MSDEPGVTSRKFQIALSVEASPIDIDPHRLKQISERLLREEGIASAEISIAIVDDRAIHRVNRQFLHHDYPTDVISFLLNDREAGERELGNQETSETERPRRHIDGEIVVSAETAARVADEFGAEPTHELALYLIHGLLHLCGFDDQSDCDRREMRQREKSHLQNFGIPAHYDEV